MARGRVAEAAGDFSGALRNYRAVKGPEQDEATLRVMRIESQLSSEKQQ